MMQRINQSQQKLILRPPNQEEKWQIYNPRYTNNLKDSILQSYQNEIKNLIKLVLITSSIMLIFNLFSISTLIILCIISVASIKCIKLEIKEIKKQGLASKLSPKLKNILFQLSIFDIYSDLLYFPKITKILSAFIGPIISKPHPDQLQESFINLNSNIQNIIKKKGLLNHAPERIQSLLIEKQNPENVPQNFGQQNWEWYNYQKYENHHQKVHQQTFVNNIIQKVDDQINWPKFMILSSLVVFGISSIKTKKLAKILIQNGSFMGVLIVLFIIVVKLKILKQKKQKKKQLQYQGILLDKQV